MLQPHAIAGIPRVDELTVGSSATMDTVQGLSAVTTLENLLPLANESYGSPIQWGLHGRGDPTGSRKADSEDQEGGVCRHGGTVI